MTVLLQSAQRETAGAVIVLAIVVVATAAIAGSASDAAAASASAWAQRKHSSAQSYPLVSQVHLRLLLLLLPQALPPPLPYPATVLHAAPHLAAQFCDEPRVPVLLVSWQHGNCAPCDVAWLCAAPRCWCWRACGTRATLPCDAIPCSVVLLRALWARQVRMPASSEPADNVLWTNLGIENIAPNTWVCGNRVGPW